MVGPGVCGWCVPTSECDLDSIQPTNRLSSCITVKEVLRPGVARVWGRESVAEGVLPAPLPARGGRAWGVRSSPILGVWTTPWASGLGLPAAVPPTAWACRWFSQGARLGRPGSVSWDGRAGRSGDPAGCALTFLTVLEWQAGSVLPAWLRAGLQGGSESGFHEAALGLQAGNVRTPGV